MSKVKKSKRNDSNSNFISGDVTKYKDLKRLTKN